MKIFPFADLGETDLVVDARYQGGRAGNAGDDPLPRLLGVSNSGGFRYLGTMTTLHSLKLVALTTTLDDPDWPDELDKETGVFTYYGDNKTPGRGLHETPRHGNELLRDVFQGASGTPDTRLRIPPILIFSAAGDWRDMIFRGLAVPGTGDGQAFDDLAAIWRIARGHRFQNYRARFTVLDVPTIQRKWIEDIQVGKVVSENAPSTWKLWQRSGQRKALVAQRSLEYRSKSEQLPVDAGDIAIVGTIHKFFSANPHGFENCAAEIARMMLPDISSIDVTRPSRDGGRDAVGKLRVGHGSGAILVDFALEAKCYGLNSSVGVREMSRLISRLRHRQFGILVTTSYVDTQAYREIKEDGHPVIIVSANDIAALLKKSGYPDAISVSEWLSREFGFAR